GDWKALPPGTASAAHSWSRWAQLVRRPLPPPPPPNRPHSPASGLPPPAEARADCAWGGARSFGSFPLPCARRNTTGLHLLPIHPVPECRSVPLRQVSRGQPHTSVNYAISYEYKQSASSGADTSQRAVRNILH